MPQLSAAHLGWSSARARRLRTPFLLSLAVLAAAPAAVPASSAAAEPSLRAGAGTADITPPQTGYFMGGWTRADRKVEGQQTRLHAKTMVLEQGGRKVALVAAELFAIPGGLQNQIAIDLADLGYAPDSIILSATHTHAGPGGFANYPTLNTGSPNLNMILTNPLSLASLLSPVPADTRLYTFLAQQIEASIRQADASLTPAVAAWGSEQLTGLTRNRSLEAHLADDGVFKAPGEGKPSDDPKGAGDTIDPNLEVLRVDQIVSGERVPIGAWTNFANHGTVVKSELRAYSGDHHAAAIRAFEAGVRAEAGVPPGRTVVNVFANGAEGDQSSGLDYTGPAGADEVGQREAASMLSAWRDAGTRLSADLAVDQRWTQVCFCGQTVAGGKVATQGNPGVPFLTGSEEGRGPLYDVTKTSLEGTKAPLELAQGQGNKVIVPVGQFPKGVPLSVVRLGDRVIATVPGEPTKEAGARIKAAVLGATSSLGIQKVVVAGLTNEYINYVTTPEEYSRQHYEGASTMYGRQELEVLKSTLAVLGSGLATGSAIPKPYPYDARRGVRPTGTPYPAGATSGTITAEPLAATSRMNQAMLMWTGGASGADRPVGPAFIRVERDTPQGWVEVDSDLGTGILWKVTANRYTARWEPPYDAPTGRYRLHVTATGYALASRPFEVVASRALVVKPVEVSGGQLAVRVSYPVPKENVDLRARPAAAAGAKVRFVLDGREVVATAGPDGVVTVQAGAAASVTVAAGGASDVAGNVSGAAVPLR